MAPLRILLVSDNRPGHFRLAEGVIAALARLRPVEVQSVEISRPKLLTPGTIWRLSSYVKPEVLLNRLYGLDPRRITGTNVVVSAGGNTLAPNIAAAAVTGAQNIFYGSIRRFDPMRFSLVLTSYARDVTAPNIVMTLKPNARDPATLPPPPSTPPTGGLLIGGNSGEFTFKAADWSAIVAFLRKDQARMGRRWIVANSPRTPADVSDALDVLANEMNGPISKYIDIRATGPGSLELLFQSAQCVLCTADSSSMLSEAVWMRRPVIALFPETADLNSSERSYRDYLENNGWARHITIGTINSDQINQLLGEIRPLPINPLDELAHLIAKRLPHLVEQS